MRLIFFITSLLLTLNLFAADNSPSAIEKRIAPVGTVNISEQAPTLKEAPEPQAEAPATPINSTQAETTQNKGKQIYETKCSICHASGVAGAPKLSDSAEWKKRYQQGMQILLQHVLQGFNAMPPKGTCTDCSEQDLQDAIDYMLKQSGAK